MRLSIITPYYKTLDNIKEIASILEPQLNEEVEWIIIDDGCDEKELDKLKANVIHLKENSGGASKPRNIGLDNAKGEYISFIDSDDLISNDYVKTILGKTKEDWDYCYISWEGKYKHIIKSEPPKWNCCVWNCVYKSSLIGNTRFREDLILAEDYWFNVKVRKGKKGNIKKILYFYHNNPDSLTKKGTTYNEKFI